MKYAQMLNHLTMLIFRSGYGLRVEGLQVMERTASQKALTDLSSCKYRSPKSLALS